MNWCEKTICEYEAKKRAGEPTSEDEDEAYWYARNVIDSEEAERRYLNGEDGR